MKLGMKYYYNLQDYEESQFVLIFEYISLASFYTFGYHISETRILEPSTKLHSPLLSLPIVKAFDIFFPSLPPMLSFFSFPCCSTTSRSLSAL